MKNKIIALTLTAVLALSSTSAFAAEKVNVNNFNLNELLNSYNIDYSTCPNKQVTAPEALRTASAPVQPAAPAETTSAPAEPVATTAAPVTAETKAAPAVETKAAPAVETKAVQPETTTTPSSEQSYEKRVVELVNVERQKNGLQPLTLDSSISNVARTKSKDMATNNYFAHQSPTYGSAGDMLTQFGINWSAWGENIASGQDTPEEVVNAWMNSEGHRANILSSNFGKIGVGYVVNSNGTPYWTQMFTN